MLTKLSRVQARANKALAHAEMNDLNTIVRHRVHKERPAAIVAGKAFTAYHMGYTSVYVSNSKVFHNATNIRDSYGAEFVGHRV